MEDMDIKEIWKAYDRKLEEARVLNLQSWALNLQCFETLQRQKMRSKLGRLALIKLASIFAALLWIYVLVLLLKTSFYFSHLFFTISVAGVLVFNLYAVAIYIRQLVLIAQINNSESIVETQLKLAELQSSTLHIVRVLFLQSPFFITYMYGIGGIVHNTMFWLILVPVTLLFVFGSVWLYRNISYKNMNKRWFKLIFSGPEWTYVTRSMGFIKEIEDFKANL